MSFMHSALKNKRAKLTVKIENRAMNFMLGICMKKELSILSWLHSLEIFFCQRALVMDTLVLGRRVK